jgi:two-component system, NarL family, nitrate/nitrite response regulator NarL
LAWFSKKENAMVAVVQHGVWQQPGDHLATGRACASIRLLVVGDHPAVRTCLYELLEAQPDFRVADAVATATEALSVAGDEEIDLAVVDHQPGGRSGLWVSRKLKRLRRPPRVVICSPYYEGVLPAAAVLAGADGVISNGRLGAELCDVIRSVAGGRLLLPIMSQRLAAMLRGSLDPEEQAIFTMRLAGIAAEDIAGRLGVSAAGLESRLHEMLSKLEALDVALSVDQSGRLSDARWSAPRRTAA